MKELIDRADPAAVEELLDTASRGLDDTDTALLLGMVRDGLTPWQAAARTRDEIGRPLSTLYHRARTLSVEISNHLGRPLSSWMEELADRGEVTGVPTHLLVALRRAAAGQGLEIEELVTVRVVARERSEA